MRTSQLVKPITRPVRDFFEEKIGILGTKLFSAFAAIASVFFLGFMMRYVRSNGVVIAWCIVGILWLVRKVVRYWWPWVWQGIINGRKYAINWFLKFLLRKGLLPERLYWGPIPLDHSDMKPFCCGDCRNAKMYYERMPDSNPRAKPTCKTCRPERVVFR